MKKPTEFSLSHPCGLRIQRGLPENRILTLGASVKRTDMQTGYVWYRLQEAEIAGRQIAMSLCFHAGALVMITVADADPAFGVTWEDWNAENEQARARATARWFAAIGFKVGTYRWGTVWAGTDPKTGDGGGGITFE